jgi:hypothetical protein
MRLSDSDPNIYLRYKTPMPKDGAVRRPSICKGIAAPTITNWRIRISIHAALQFGREDGHPYPTTQGYLVGALAWYARSVPEPRIVPSDSIMLGCRGYGAPTPTHWSPDSDTYVYCIATCDDRKD